MTEDVKLYSMADVKQHNTNKSCWFVIHNNIYDVTEFLNEHPGGEEVHLEQAGKDATEPWEDIGHSMEARNLMKKYKVGELIESERRDVPEKKEPVWGSTTTSASTTQSFGTQPSVSTQNVDVQEESVLKVLLKPLIIVILVAISYKFFYDDGGN